MSEWLDGWVYWVADPENGIARSTETVLEKLGLGFAHDVTKGFNGSTRDTKITIPYWLMMAFASVLPSIWLKAWFRRRWPRLNPGYCSQCGYDLRATPLHNHMIEFPRAAHNDRPDAVAMAVALLDPFVMLGLEEEGAEVNLANDNAPPLEEVLGDWRAAP